MYYYKSTFLIVKPEATITILILWIILPVKIECDFYYFIFIIYRLIKTNIQLFW